MRRRQDHKDKRALLETYIGKLCRNFKIHEMEEHILPIFRKVTWNQIVYILKKNRKTVTSAHITLVLMTIVNREAFAFLEDMYFELFLANKVVHSGKYTWYAFKMSGGVGRAGLVTASQISEAVKMSFRSLAHQPIVKVKLFGAFSWIMIQMKKQDRFGKNFGQPFIFACSPEEPYFFASQKTIKTEISDGLLPSLGHRRFINCNLSGSDIVSMIKQRRNKTANAFDAHSAQHAAPQYTPGPGVATEHGMDFTDQHQKINYANMVFGKDCPVVKQLFVRMEGHQVKDTQIYQSSMKILSKNVFEFLKRLFVRGVINVPLLPYFERLPTLGKNNIKIRECTAQDTSQTYVQSAN